MTKSINFYKDLIERPKVRSTEFFDGPVSSMDLNGKDKYKIEIFLIFKISFEENHLNIRLKLFETVSEKFGFENNRQSMGGEITVKNWSRNVKDFTTLTLTQKIEIEYFHFQFYLHNNDKLHKDVDIINIIELYRIKKLRYPYTNN